MNTITATITGNKRAPLGDHVLETTSIANKSSSTSGEIPGSHNPEDITKKKKVPQAISLLNNGWDASDEAIQQQTEKEKLQHQKLKGFYWVLASRWPL